MLPLSWTRTLKENFPNSAVAEAEIPPADCQVMGKFGQSVTNLPGKSGGKSVGKPTKGKEERILDVLNSAGGCPPDFKAAI